MSEKKNRRRFSDKEISLFCSQLALILRSGITLSDGIEAMKDDEGGESNLPLNELHAELEQGNTMYQALQTVGSFPDYLVNMVEIGEKTGRLEKVMESLATYYDREDSLKQSIRNAVVYPMLMVLMMAAVILVLVVRVLPVFEEVFNDLGGGLSSTATTIMNIGMAASKWAMIFLVVVVVVVALLYLYSKTAKGSGFFGRFGDRIPLSRKLTNKIAAGRFASALSLMLSSGYDANSALELIPGLLPSPYIKTKVKEIKEKVDSGESLAVAISQSGVFPGLYSKMITVGFKTGTVDEVMENLANVYEDEIDTSLNNFVAVLEPVLVSVLAVIVGIVLISIMLPLVGIMSSIG